MIIRRKNPEVDLKLKYNKVLENCLILSLAILLVLFLSSSSMELTPYAKTVQQEIIKVEDIPETHQVKKLPPPPPRPSVPIETEREDVSEEVTIESTELDLDEPPLPPPPPPAPPPTEPVFEFYQVSEPPVTIREVIPEYPEIARKAGIEGKVFTKLLVNQQGRVDSVAVLKGPEVFIDAAVKAATQLRFKPARQNDKPVRVWVSQVFVFRLK